MNLQPFMEPLRSYLEIPPPPKDTLAAIFYDYQPCMKDTNIQAITLIFALQNDPNLTHLNDYIGVDSESKPLFADKEIDPEIIKIAKTIQPIFQRVPDGWGVIIPCKSDVVWAHQTQGVLCNQVYLEGIFVPLPDVSGRIEFHKCGSACEDVQKLNGLFFKENPDWDWLLEPDRQHKLYSMLDQLAIAEYDFDNPEFSIHSDSEYHGYTKDACIVCTPDKFNVNPEDIWKAIKKESGLDWEPIERPENYPYSQEAFEWVKITKIPEPSGHGDPDYRGLLNKRVALVYPNSD